MTQKIDLTSDLLWRNDRPYNPKYFYGSKIIDEYMLRNNDSQPIYGHLARKVLSHYLGDKYDPQIEPFSNECIVRDHIECLIQFKIHHRLKEYDWEYIDNIFKWIIGGIYKVNLGPDQKRIDEGFSPINKRHEPKFEKFDG